MTAAPERADERGAVAIVVAVVASVLFVTAALVIDLGLARDTRRQAQNAADASVLAAANALFPDSLTCTAGAATPPCFTDATGVAMSYAETNYAVKTEQWSGCTDPLALPYRPAGTSCISFDTSAAAVSEVRVVVPTRTNDTAFGGVAGVEEIAVAARAQAAVSPGRPGTAECGLCVSGDTAISGNPTVEVNDSSIHVNTNSYSGNATVRTNGQFITREPPRVSGRVTLPPRVAGGLPPDPLAHIALPFSSQANELPTRGSVSYSGRDTCTLLPGRYGSISLSGSSRCTMQPGLYAITGAVSFSGTSSLDGASGVTLYFTCGSTSAVRECGAAYPFVEYGGSLGLTGTNDIDIVAPRTGAPWDGLAIVYDRNNANNLDYSGTNGNLLRGSVYAKSATMNLSGTADTSGIDSLFVLKNLRVSGNGTIKIGYTPANNPTMPVQPGEISLSQ